MDKKQIAFRIYYLDRRSKELKLGIIIINERYRIKDISKEVYIEEYRILEDEIYALAAERSILINDLIRKDHILIKNYIDQKV